MNLSFTVENQTYFLHEVAAKQITPGCFIADPVFSNCYKSTATNRLNMFISPNEDTRFSSIQLTFGDIVKDDAKFTSALKQFDRLTDKYPGILITSQGPNWLRFAHRIRTEKQKLVYFADLMNPNNIYYMRPY